MVKEVIKVKESFLFFGDAAGPGEAEESVVKGAFLFGPLEDVFGLLVELLFGDFLISIDDGWDNGRAIILVGDIVGSVFSEETDAFGEFVFFH